MVEEQIAARGIHDPRLLQAMRQVPREVFVPENLRAFAYDDTPLPIGHGQTISQPFIVATMIEKAAITAGDKVLEVGAGSGYAAAVLSRLAGEVFAIERHTALAELAKLRLANLGYANVTIIAGDGSKGYPEEAPFDVIMVAACSPELPAMLKQQLKVGGRLIIPVGGKNVQMLMCVVRNSGDEWTATTLGQVRFVPLIEGEESPGNGTS